MKKQINPTIKAHLIRGAFYLLLLLAVGAIPFALAQRNTGKRITAEQIAIVNGHKTVPLSAGAIPGKPVSAAAAAAQSQMRNDTMRVPATSHLLAPASAFRAPAPKLPNTKRIIRSLMSNVPLFTYVIDDGTAEDSVGLTAGGSLVACNEFTVTGGNNVITSISIAWGTPAFPDPTLNGLPYTAVLWSDPNGDGSPTDAVVLAMAPGVISQEGTNTFITTTIPPTMVTTANFFVGFLITHAAGQFPAALDESNPIPNRSWVDATSNINDLSGAITIESAGLPGNWLIRADANTGGPTPTGTPSPTPTATINPCSTYVTIPGTGAITPGTTDTGNHCDDCATAVTLPFPVSVYGQTFTTVNVASNGSLDLIGTQAPFTTGCIVLPSSSFTMAILPYQDDLRTDNISFTGCNAFPGATCGIFTSVTGTAPNRQFNIEWRAVHFADTTTSVNFEVVFSENSQTHFDVIYGATSDNGLGETSGVQASSTGPATTFSCGTATLTNGLKVTYTCQGAASPTPTPTGTPSCSPGPLWYNGDFNGVNGLANENNDSLSAGPIASVYDDFIVPSGPAWNVTSVFSDNLLNTNVTGATWEIRQGVAEGTGGTLIASGMTMTPVVTLTGRSGFGFNEFMVEVIGLNVSLPPGTYWLNVTPIGDLTGRSFDSTTSGANCVGMPCGNDLNAFFNSAFFGANWQNTAEQGQPSDFSMGVNGTVGTCGTPTATPTASPSASATATPTATAPATATPTAPATATPTATATPSCSPNYTFTSGTGTLVPGVDDTGNHCDDCLTSISLPFPVMLYDQSFTTANVGSNGSLQFGATNPSFDVTCSPFGFAGTTYVMAPYWTDQCSGNCFNDTCPGCGIFTTTTGTSPNRTFYVEYRIDYYQITGTTTQLDYEIALFENGGPPFQFIYDSITPAALANDSQLVVGVKQNDTTFTQYRL